jgi:hypothetical protein
MSAVIGIYAILVGWVPSWSHYIIIRRVTSASPQAGGGGAYGINESHHMAPLPPLNGCGQVTGPPPRPGSAKYGRGGPCFFPKDPSRAPYSFPLPPDSDDLCMQFQVSPGERQYLEMKQKAVVSSSSSIKQ